LFSASKSETQAGDPKIGQREKATGRIVRAHNDAVRVAPGEQFDAEVAVGMLNSALRTLTNASTTEKAWKALFSKKDVVGLKLNCLAGPGLSSHPVVTAAIIAGLRNAGVEEKNIIVWERFDRELIQAGYTINRRSLGPRIFGTEGRYDNEIVFAESIGSSFTPIVRRLCTALINVPVLKDHDLSGVGIGLKNFFGAIHNPNKYHDNHCDPYLADLSACPLIREKLRLIVCDALNGQYHGGPALKREFLWSENSLLVGTDPVALDTVGWEMIEAQRRQNDLPNLEEAGRPPTWLTTAADRGLGESRREKIEVVSV
jgi:uncharacterized protein (DUF362 family)